MPAVDRERSSRTDVRSGGAPSGTVTFMFTDIEGSTRLLERLRGRYADLLAEHRRLLRAAFSEWRGHEVETQGDSFFVAFARASDAVGAAVAGQRALGSAEWPDGVEVRVRMGIHTGEPLVAGPDYLGMEVHRAARVAAVGHGGQILLSGVTRDLVVDELADDVKLTDLGTFQLKDIRREMRLYQVAGPGLRAEFGPLVTPPAEEPPPAPGEAPYRGLQAFEEADADLFYGREAVVDGLVERLRDAPFLALIGASGSGKSSILRAGLVPRLRREGARVLLLTPTAHPIEELTATLDPDAPASRLAELTAEMRAEPRALALGLRRNETKGRRTIIAVDQLEELFTLCRDEAERESFLSSLTHASGLDGSPAGSATGAESATVVVTLRADFYASLAPYEVLRAAAANSQVYVGAMNPAELQRAIEEPARRGGWQFVPGLVDLLLRDVGDEPGALPLLSHALLETWQRRRGTTMTLRSYAESGGVKGAIARTADRVYVTELSEPQKRIAREIFVRLTELGEESQDTRRRARLDELMPAEESRAREVSDVIRRLADARLVTLGENTVEVAHEALIREWPTLREWLSTDREGLRVHRRLTDAALEWEVSGYDESLLFRGARLAQARELTAYKGVANPLERRFLDASVAFEEAEAAERDAARQRELAAAQAAAAAETRRAEHAARAARGLRRRAILLAGALSVAGVLAAVAFVLAQQSDANASLAAQRAEEARTNAALAEQRANEARQNADLAEQAARDARDNEALALTQAKQSRAQRLAANATQILLNGREPELAALLALAALDTEYTTQADAALQRAGRQVSGRQFDHHAEVIGIAVSPDGRTIFTTASGEVHVWDVQSASEVAQLPIPVASNPDLYWQIELSDDGTTLIASDYSGPAAMWRLDPDDPTDNQEIGLGCPALESGVHAMSGDGRLVVRYADSELVAWKMPECERYGASIRAEELNDPAVSPDGSLVAASILSNSILVIWDIATGREVSRVVRWTNSFWHPSFSKVSSTVGVGMFDGTALTVDVSTGALLQTFRGHEDAVERAIFSPDGSRLLTSSQDGTARVWDAGNGTEFRRFVHQGSVRQSALTRDGSSVFTASVDGLAREWSAAGEEIAFIAGNGEVASLSFSADGTRLASAAGDEVKVFDLTAGAVISGASLPQVKLVGFSPVGDTLLAVSAFETTLLNASDGRPVRVLASSSQPEGDAATAASFSGDGSVVLAPLPGGVSSLVLYETATGALRQAFDMEVGTLSFDGSRVAGWSHGRYSIYDAATGAGVGLIRLDQVDYRRIDLQLTADASYLVSGDHDNVVRVRDVTDGAVVAEMRGHTAAIRQVRLSADGRYIVTAGDDGGARLWDVPTGDQLRYLSGHDGVTITGIAISPDGETVALGSADGTVIIAPTSIEQLALNVCGRLGRDLTDEERTAYGIEDGGTTCP